MDLCEDRSLVLIGHMVQCGDGHDRVYHVLAHVKIAEVLAHDLDVADARFCQLLPSGFGHVRRDIDS